MGISDSKDQCGRGWPMGYEGQAHLGAAGPRWIGGSRRIWDRAESGDRAGDDVDKNLVFPAFVSRIWNFQEGHGGAAGSGEAWPFRGIMAARKQVRCGPDMYGHNLPAAHVGVFAH